MSISRPTSRRTEPREKSPASDGFEPLQPHPIFKEGDGELTEDEDGDEYRCRYGRRWCPGPKALKHGILPCIDCRRDAEDHLVAAYDEYEFSEQYVATPRNRRAQP